MNDHYYFLALLKSNVSDGDSNKGALISEPDAKALLVDAYLVSRDCRAKN